MKAPVQIGRLQRFACDTAVGPGRAVLRAGSADGQARGRDRLGPGRALSCAHELRRLGHDVVVFEARDVPGGLDTLGIAAYKISTEFALSEIEMIRQIGIDIELGHRVTGAQVRELLTTFDAVFLGIGLGRTLPLGIDGEELEGVWEALDFIFQTHTKPLTECQVGVECAGDRRGQHGDRRRHRRQAARGRDRDDRLPAVRGPDTGVRLRIRPGPVRRRPLRVVCPAGPSRRRRRHGPGR